MEWTHGMDSWNGTTLGMAYMINVLPYVQTDPDGCLAKSCRCSRYSYWCCIKMYGL